MLYAFYIGLGVSVTIHWFSEFAADALAVVELPLAPPGDERDLFEAIAFTADFSRGDAAAYLALAMIFRLLFAGLYQLVFARR